MCASCGRENRDGAAFCAGCGIRLTRACTGCGAEIAPDARFCDRCGAPIDVPPAAANEPRVPAGDRKMVTVVFGDLSGSTTLQERIDAEATSRLMDRIQHALAAAVNAHDGRVVKTMGDGIMAVFGIPVLREDDAVRAVRAAMAMQAAFAALEVPELSLRVGVNTGEVVVAPDSDDVVGDPVNVAARLEAAAGVGEIYVGPETQRLVRDVIALEPVAPLALKGKAEAVAAARVVGVSAAAPSTETPFLGREDDLRALLEVLDDAVATASARLATVVGWPGLGKSRLADELVRRVRDRATVIEARFLADAGASFGPIAEAVRRAVDLATIELGNDRERVATTIDALLGGGSAGPTEQVFWAIRRVLEGLAASAPAVVVLDDLHWAEPAMLDLVEHLAEWTRGGPVVLLALARPELRDRRPALLDATGPSSTVLVLDGLDEGACRQLALDVLGADDLPAGVLDRALTASEGNPLFLRELLRLLVDDGVLQRQGDHWALTVELDAIQLPATIHAALAARIEQLQPDERNVLQAASVIGRHFARGAVAALLQPSVADRLDEHLSSLHRRALVDPEGTWWGDERMYRFHHVLIRDAAYRRVLKEVRADQHVRYADWLAARASDGTGEHDEVLGFHLEQAIGFRRELDEPVDPRLVRRAVGHLGDAGRRALDGDDLANAASLLGRTLALEPGDADLLRDRCEALVSSGDVHAAAAAVAELAATATDERARALADVFDAQLAAQRDPGSLADVARRAGEAAATLAGLGDDLGVAKAESVQAGALAGLGQVGACEAALDRSLAAARRAGDNRRANVVLSLAPGAALWGPSPIARASGRCLDVVRVLRITSWAPHVEAHALRHQAVLEAMRDRADAARRMVDSARTTFTDLGHRLGLLETSMHEGLVELLDGHPEAAEEPLRRAVDGFSTLGARARAAQATALLARSLLELDRLDEARSLADPGLAGDDLKAAIGLLGVAAECRARHGEIDEAEALARQAVALAEPTDALVDHADARLALARVLAAAGRATEAAAEARRAGELYEAKGATVGMRRAEAGGAVASSRDATVGAPSAAIEADLSRTARRWRENEATATSRRMAAAIAVSDLDTVSSIISGAAVSDHDLLADLPAGNSAAVLRWIARSSGVMEVEPLATLGDRHALERTTFRFTERSYDSTSEIVKITVTAVLEGCVTVQDTFSRDDLASASACLVERWAEDELEGAEGDRAQAGSKSWLLPPTINAGDWDEVARLHDPAVVLVDHRSSGVTVRGAEAVVEWLRAGASAAEGFEVRIDDVLALTPRASLARWHAGGVMDGGSYSLPSFIASRVGAAGPVDRVEIFEVEDLDAAWACFDALDGGAERRVAANLATEVARRRSMLTGDGRMDEARRLFSTDFVFTDHGLRTDWPVEAHVTSLVSTRPLIDRVEPLASLGARHALVRSRNRWASGDVAEVEYVHLNVIRTDADGRYLRLDSVGEEELSSALRLLVERWAEDELTGPERDRQLKRAETFSSLDAATAGDWSSYRSLLDDQLVVMDHRLEGVGEVRGIDAVTEWLRYLEASSDGELRVTDVLGLTEDVSMLETRATGESRGAAFEIPSLLVTACGLSGHVDRFDVFSTDQADQAWACFEHAVAAPSVPRRRVVPNDPVRLFERWGEAARAGDAAGAAAVYAPDAEYHHHVLQATITGDQLQVGARHIIERGGLVGHIDPIATLGGRHALVGLELSWPSDHGTLSTLSMLEVCRSGPDGLERIDVFGEDQLAAAGTCLFERWAEDELSGEARARMLRMAEIWSIDEVIRRRDWARFMQLFEGDVVLRDHRGRIETRGPEALTAWLRELIAPSDVFDTELVDVLAVTEHAMLWVRRTAGEANGGEFAWPSLNVVAFGATGRVSRLEFFSPDAPDDAWACFEGCVVEPVPTRRVVPNLATDTLERWLEVMRTTDSDALAQLYTPDFVFAHAPLAADLPDADHFANLADLQQLGIDASIEVLATVGRRHALYRSINRFVPQHGGASEVLYLAVACVDDEGRFTRIDAFREDELGAAFECLCERWAEAELPGHKRDAARRFAGSITARRSAAGGDWEQLRDQYADDIVFTAHGTSTPVIRGAGALIDWQRSLHDATDLARGSLIDVHALTPAVSMLTLSIEGIRDGGAFADPRVNVSRRGLDGRIVAIDSFPPEQPEEAWACYDAAVAVAEQPLRRITPNVASRTTDAWAAAIRAGDEAGSQAMRAPHFLYEDHELRLTFDFEEQARRQGHRPPSAVDVETVATLGDRHSLHRFAVVHDGDHEKPAIRFDLLLVNSVVDDRIVRTDAFPPEHLAAALSCLVTRWAEEELAEDERPRGFQLAQGMLVADRQNERDWDGFAALYERDAVLVDRRPTGWGELRGPDEIRHWLEELVLAAERAENQLLDVLALTPRATVWRWCVSGERTGGEFQLPSVIVSQFSAAGRFHRVELYAPEHLDEAFACFERFDRVEPSPAAHGTTRRVAHNLAIEAALQSLAAIRARDGRALTALWADGFALTNRSLQTELSAGERRQTLDAVMPTLTEADLDLLASLGRRHGLVRFRIRYRDPEHGGEVEAAHLYSGRTNDDGLLTHQDRFDEGDLAAALEWLVTCWAEDEAPDEGERERALRIALAHGHPAAIVRHEWDALLARYAPDAVVVDHRPAGVGVLEGPDAIVGWFRGFVEMADELEVAVADVLELTIDCALTQWCSRGVAGGVAFETNPIIAVRFDAKGLIERVEFFAADDGEAARATYDAWLAVSPRSSVRCRVRPNLASATRERLASAVRVGDVDALMATKAHGYVMVDHIMHSTFDVDEHRRRLSGLGPAEVEQELLTTLGDRHALHRTRIVWRDPAEGGLMAFDRLAVSAVDGSGAVTREDNFEVEQLARALGCLYERWATEERGDPRLGLQLAASWTYGERVAARDWDGYGALLVDDVVQVDHRPTGAGEITGRAAVVAWIRELLEVMDHLRADVVDVLAATPSAAFVRNVASGAAAGGPVEILSNVVFRYAPDGRLDRFEMFAIDRLDDAWACFKRFERRERTGRRVVPNRAVATLEASMRAASAGGVEATAPLYSPDYVADRHDLLVTFDLEAYRQEERWLVEEAQVRVDVLATLGDRHCLYRFGYTWPGDPDVGEPQVEALVACQIDEQGRFRREDLFRADRLSDALGCLVERWGEDEADEAERERARGLHATVRYHEHVAARDWEAIRSLYAADVLFVDHRPTAAGELRGPDAVVRWLHTYVDQVSELLSRFVDVLGFTPHALALQTHTRAVADGVALEMEPLALIRLDDDGRIDRFAVFDPEQSDAALAQFDEWADPEPASPGVRRRVRPNLATAAYDQWAAAVAASGDPAARSELDAPGYTRFDHELLAELPGRRDDLVAAGYRIIDASFEPVASLGERHALCRMVVVWRDADGEEVRFERLAVTRVDDDGRVRRDDLFSSDRLWEATRCLLERWAEAEATEGERRRAETTAGCFDFPVWHRERDWDRMGDAIVADAVLVDHRPASAGPCAGRAAIVDYFRQFAASVDSVESELLDVLAFTPDGAVTRMRSAGELAGAAFEWESLTVARVAVDGRFARLEMFPPEALDEAWACFDQVDGYSVGSTGPTTPGVPARNEVDAPRRGVDPDNVAWRNVQRWARAVRDGDLGAALAAYPEGYQMVRHDQHVVEDAESWREVEEAISGGLVSVEPVVTLGDRHVLSRVTIGWERDGAEVGMETLIVARAGSDGRTIREDVFQSDRLDLAMGGLVERWAEDELSGRDQEVAMARAARWRDASVAYGDWERYAANFAADAVLVDHRPSGAGEIVGARGMTDWSRALASLVDRITTRPVDVLAVTTGGLALGLQLASGESADGMFEIPTYIVVSTNEAALIDRMEHFSVDQLDEAWECFDRLAGAASTASQHRHRQVIPTTAWATVERWSALASDGDGDGVRDLYASGYELHRHDQHTRFRGTTTWRASSTMWHAVRPPRSSTS